MTSVQPTARVVRLLDRPDSWAGRQTRLILERARVDVDEWPWSAAEARTLAAMLGHHTPPVVVVCARTELSVVVVDHWAGLDLDRLRELAVRR